MEGNEKREDRAKRIAIIALILALLACTFGFAAFSRSIKIMDEKKEIGYATLYGGILSINPDKPENGKVYPTSIGGAKADPATLTENGIININVHFTKPGQSATYSFYGINPTKTLVYLNSVLFGEKTCHAGSGTTDSYAEAACNNIIMTISAKDTMFTETNEDIEEHSIPAESNEPIAITIKYLKGGADSDGSFSVDFGTSYMTYGEID